jgi:AcrR family transcriptional regulator
MQHIAHIREMPSMAEMTLRERNKAKRRDAIIDAAIPLFATKGYHETTIPEIAEAAEVAPRTVSLHFPAKLDIVRADVERAGRDFEAAFAQRTPDDTVLELCITWLRHWLLEPGDRQARDRLRMYAENEELGSLVSNRIIELVDTAINADPTMTDEIHDPGDRQIVGAAMAGVMRYLASIDDPANFERQLARVQTFFAAGARALRTCRSSP